MSRTLSQAADTILHQVVTAKAPVPGVVAMATNRGGTIYEGASGKRIIGQEPGMTSDTVFAIFSCTKAITGTAIMQLVEEGKLDLDAPAKNYVPDLGAVRVLEAMGPTGQPTLRGPKRDITTRMLMLHTAGFGYEFFNEKLRDYAASTGQVSVITATKAALGAPLVSDPGENWEYGCNIDWCGQIVEAIRGKRLGEVMQERIFEPLGMTDSAFTISPAMRPRLARVHQREADGSLAPMPDFELPQDPEVQMGGHGLYSTVSDYSRFIRMYLNDGAGDYGQVLKPETVRLAAANGLGDKKIRALPAAIPALTNSAEFFPGLSKSWSLSFMVNDEPAPTGRSAGSLGWAGLANLFFWIDRTSGVGGFWATQVFPFGDPTSVTGFMEFESAVYRSLSAH